LGQERVGEIARGPLTLALSPKGRWDFIAPRSTPSPLWGEGWGEGVARCLTILCARTAACILARVGECDLIHVDTGVLPVCLTTAFCCTQFRASV
jgi:hypothetical protein